MNRLEELLFKWQDQSLTAAELSELNTWLAQPEGRARLAMEFEFDAALREALHAEIALAGAQQQAKAYQTLEVRHSEVFQDSRTQSLSATIERWLRFAGFLRFGWKVLLAGAVCSVLLGAAVFYALMDEAVARIEGNGRGVTILRGTKALTATSGFTLKSGDRIKTSTEATTTLVYAKETTQIRFQPGTQLRFEQGEDGKRLELIQGAITAKVAPQPKGQPMLLTTPQAEVKVIGTEFMLAVNADTTRLEVTQGAVQLANRDDGKAVVVNGGFYALAGKGVDLATRSLLPNPWHSQDIGAVGLPGQARIDGQQCKVKAAGKNNCKTKDQFHFVYQTLDGDGEIRARVVDVELTHQQAKAGVVIRDNLKTAAPHAFLFLRAGSGLEFEHRPKTDSKIDWISGESAPYWVRLVRQGETVTAYKSPDGTAWAETGSDTIQMGRRIYIGLGVSSWNNAALTTSIFDNVSVLPASPSDPPANLID